MKWKEISKNYKFKDGSVITQKHQTHLYDCYEIEYEGKKITLSKDHILKVNISKLPIEAQEEIKSTCNGRIPLKEDLNVDILGYVSDENKKLLQQYLLGEIRDVPFRIEEISEGNTEAYIININGKSSEVFVKRIPTEYEDQKINEEEYWIPVEGIAYLFNKYGELEI